jgi:hypothetical protein
MRVRIRAIVDDVAADRNMSLGRWLVALTAIAWSAYQLFEAFSEQRIFFGSPIGAGYWSSLADRPVSFVLGIVLWTFCLAMMSTILYIKLFMGPRNPRTGSPPNAG